MKKKLFLAGMAALMCAIGLVVVGCDNGSTGGGKSGDPITSGLYGRYRVTSPTEAVGHTITVGDGTWSMRGHTVDSYGTYTLSADQRTATLYAYDVGPTVGMVYISGTILTGKLNKASGYPGTYKAEKMSS